jgi:cell division protein FtsB
VVRVRRRAWIVGLAAAALVAFLYYRPVQAYMRAQDTLHDRADEVRSLTREKARLARRLKLDESGATLVREARRLGLVRADEHLFIVKGIDEWRKARAKPRKPTNG